MTRRRPDNSFHGLTLEEVLSRRADRLGLPTLGGGWASAASITNPASPPARVPAPHAVGARTGRGPVPRHPAARHRPERGRADPRSGRRNRLI